MNDSKEVGRLVGLANHILILGHTSPDGDCLGAMLAVAAVLDRIDKPCTLALADRIPDFLDFLPGCDRVRISPQDLPQADLAIIPDCSDLGRLGYLNDRFGPALAAMPIVNVDHHVSNGCYGQVNLVDTTAAAVCEQMFFLFAALDFPLDAKTSTCLLTGVVTDTQNFRTPSVTPRTMRVATALIEAGAPLPMIADRVYNSRRSSTLRLWALALSHLEESDGIVWTRMNDEMLAKSGASWEESDALINLLSSVRSADVAILFKEHADGVRVSLRSNGQVDMAAVAAEFGGGGHRGAAGCTVNASCQEAQQLVVERVRVALNELSTQLSSHSPLI